MEEETDINEVECEECHNINLMEINWFSDDSACRVIAECERCGIKFQGILTRI